MKYVVRIGRISPSKILECRTFWNFSRTFFQKSGKILAELSKSFSLTRAQNSKMQVENSL